jgi:hypothetical protein
MPTKVEISDHWTDTGRKVFLAEVKVATDLLRNLPRLMIEVPDQGNVSTSESAPISARPTSPLSCQKWHARRVTMRVGLHSFLDWRSPS